MFSSCDPVCGLDCVISIKVSAIPIAEKTSSHSLKNAKKHIEFAAG